MTRRLVERMNRRFCASILGVTLLLAGCAGTGRSSGQAHPQSPTRAVSGVTSSAVDWRSQALGLAAALQHAETVIGSTTEPKPGSAPAGTFGALIVGVDETHRAILVDRTGLATGADSDKRARQAGIDSPPSAWVVNSTKERLPLTVAPNAAFILWYVEDAQNVSPPESASMSVLTFDQVASVYAHDPVKRDQLLLGGGWLTVDGQTGNVTTFIQPVYQ